MNSNFKLVVFLHNIIKNKLNHFVCTRILESPASLYFGSCDIIWFQILTKNEIFDQYCAYNQSPTLEIYLNLFDIRRRTRRCITSEKPNMFSQFHDEETRPLYLSFPRNNFALYAVMQMAWNFKHFIDWTFGLWSCHQIVSMQHLQCN